MSDHAAGNDGDNQDHGPAATVPLGSKMPMPARKVPVLGAAVREGGASSQRVDDGVPARSEIANGLNFTGDAVLTGVCTVKGRVLGNLKQAAAAKVAVIVTESGFVKGDIFADQISVMGRTEGLLDATGGTVALHETASVAGHVRYSKIQVNGSELNATLERSPPVGKQAAPASPAQAASPDPLPEVQFPPGSVPGEPGGAA